MAYYCPNCGALNDDAVPACFNCGTPNPNLTAAAPPPATSPYEAPTQPQPSYQMPSYPPPVTYGTGAFPQNPPQDPFSPLTPPTAPYTPPAYGTAWHPEPTPPAVAARLQSQARMALILGLLGVLCCGLLGPIALAIGIQTRNDLRRLGIDEGQSMALAGLILGALATVVWLFLWLMNSLS